MASRNSSTDYTGPSVGEMISTHTLAREIMSRNEDACGILDDLALQLLRRFVELPAFTDPGRVNDFLAEKSALLHELDMVDAPGEAPGTRASAMHGSLVGYVIARHGTEQPIMLPLEILQLQAWFKTEPTGAA